MRALRLCLVVAVVALAGLPNHSAAQRTQAIDPDTMDRTVAYNRLLTDLIVGYMDATASDSLSNAMQSLINPPDREKAVAAARQALAEYTAKIEALKEAYRALPDPPADYLPNARANLENNLAFIDFLAQGAEETGRTLYGQIAAVMRGDIVDAATLAQGEVEQIIMELGAENAFIRFQLTALSASNPTRGLFEATILGNEAVRSYLTFINRYSSHDMGNRLRLLGEIALWLSRLDAKLDTNETGIGAMCRSLATLDPKAARTAADSLCQSLREANAIERDIFGIITTYSEYAKAKIAETVDADIEARLDAAEVQIGQRVNDRVAIQRQIVERSAALNRALATAPINRHPPPR
ncbi:MAG: hypothetical protein AAGF49_05750 [Pseudomonadota bacterium]